MSKEYMIAVQKERLKSTVSIKKIYITESKEAVFVRSYLDFTALEKV